MFARYTFSVLDGVFVSVMFIGHCVIKIQL